MMKSFIKKIITALRAIVPVSGLEISDGAVRFIRLHEDGSVAQQAMVILSPQVVHEGRLLDEVSFFNALLDLRSQIQGAKKELPVIISLPPAPVYAQVFSLPILPPQQLEDAARLNLRMISPINFDTAYADWQAVEADRADTSGGAVEALGAFVESSVVDQYTRVLKRARFMPVAVEFASISLARVVRDSTEIDLHEPYVMVSINSDGVSFLILVRGSPYFTRFIGWSQFGEAPVSVNHFQSLVGAELRRLFNFYRSKRQNIITKAFIINTTSNKELAAWVKKEFLLEVFVLSGYHTMDRAWFVAIGAALRGLIPRADDRFISLARVGTEEDFARNRVWRFIALWRTIIFALMGFIVAAYFVADLVLLYSARSAREAMKTASSDGQNQEIIALQTEAHNFNALVDKAAAARDTARPWSAIIRDIQGIAMNGKISFTEIQLNAARNTVAIRGTAESEQGVIAFKSALTNNAAIAAVSLPLSAITTIPGGRAAFTATITIK